MVSPYNWLMGLIALVTGAANASSNAAADIAKGFSPADLEDDPSISKVVVKRYSGSGDGSLPLIDRTVPTDRTVLTRRTAPTIRDRAVATTRRLRPPQHRHPYLLKQNRRPAVS